MEELEFKQEDEAKQFAAELLDHLATSRGRATLVVLAVCRLEVRVYIPVAMISSMTMTFWPGLIASDCIWKKS